MPRRFGLFLLLPLLALILSALPTTPARATPQAPGDILVTYPGNDDIGSFLESNFGLVKDSDWTEIDPEDLDNPELIASAKTIFINCGSYTFDIEAAGATLREFVRNGGTLYASDFAYDYIEYAFPGYVAFAAPDPKIGQEGVITATVTDSGLRNYLFGSSPESTISLNYDLPNWAVIDRPLHGDVQVLMRGDVPIYDAQGEPSGQVLANRPLAVSFPFGEGHVVYTTFHNEAQLNELEQRLLEYLVLEPFTGILQSEVAQTLRSANLLQAREHLKKLSQGATAQGFYSTSGGRSMTLAVGLQSGSIRLSLYRPDGSLYAQQDGSTTMRAPSAVPLIISVPAQDLTPGTWRYELTALSLPSSSVPAVVGIGVTPSNIFVPAVRR